MGWDHSDRLGCLKLKNQNFDKFKYSRDLKFLNYLNVYFKSFEGKNKVKGKHIGTGGKSKRGNIQKIKDRDLCLRNSMLAENAREKGEFLSGMNLESSCCFPYNRGFFLIYIDDDVLKVYTVPALLRE